MFSFGIPQIAMHSRGMSLSLILRNHKTSKDYTICLTVSDKKTDKQFSDDNFSSRLAA